MGVGRRMKKQGLPPPLDESKISRKKVEFSNPRGTKRKADYGNDIREKKRKSFGGINTQPQAKPQSSTKTTNGIKNSGLKDSNKGTFGNGKISHQAQIRQAAAKPCARKRIVSLDYVPDDPREEIIGSKEASPEEGYMSGALWDGSDGEEESPGEEVPDKEVAKDHSADNKLDEEELPEDQFGSSDDELNEEELP